ncbi:phosphatase PAP2 family protein [Microbacterium sp. NPDC077391]|uniref:Phosphatase PAP2 family protein n=1 Tax=Microbacterium commune TaxID=2762219 RepID=A0ABR8W5U0_9MICO|nr:MULTISPECIES: phosphatase PAP2 family protein [Microbacterium]MBD8012387.1 phosphatase PAP2 family protein [Microbacterium commune]
MTRRALLISGSAMLTLAALLGVLVVLLPRGATIGLDVFWNGLMSQVRQDWMLSAAYLLNWIGGGWVAIVLVPLLIVLLLVLLRRWRGAVFAAIAFVVSAGLTQLLKEIFARARPDDMLVTSDFGSFPSGHTSNAATIAVVLWLVFPRVWVAIIGAVWVMAMALSRTLLAVHWFTDTVGGALVGASAALLVGAFVLSWASLGWTPASSASRSSRDDDPPVP